MSLQPDYYIGLMSGTSLDGVDGVLADLSAPAGIHVLQHVHIAMPAMLRSELMALNSATDNELHRGALAANQLIEQLYAPAVHQLLAAAHIPPSQVTAIGAHGQTVRHHPHSPSGLQLDPSLNQTTTGYTIQLNAPALLAELTHIPVICDFRSRDIAAGGQGAPLVPAFHQQIFQQPGKAIAVLNLGGIANLTIIRPDRTVIGFDCGPANALMDDWCEKHTGHPYDTDGSWASQGQYVPELLQEMLKEPYFRQAPPKSTGRDLFNPSWLEKHLKNFTSISAVDIQATLLELTVNTCASALKQHAPDAAQLIVCGGGALNLQLMHRLQTCISPIPLTPSATYGLPELQVEAVAFAWLAQQCLRKQPANLPEVTGAKGPRILGAIYSA